MSEQSGNIKPRPIDGLPFWAGMITEPANSFMVRVIVPDEVSSAQMIIIREAINDLKAMLKRVADKSDYPMDFTFQEIPESATDSDRNHRLDGNVLFKVIVPFTMQDKMWQRIAMVVVHFWWRHSTWKGFLTQTVSGR